jgi:hypothetical protein
MTRAVEIVDAEEEPDSAGCLGTDSRSLAFAVRSDEKKPGLCPRRADDHPPLGPPAVGERRRVLDEVEAEYAVKNAMAESYSSTIRATRSICTRAA